jgi:hypothetical protein
MRPENPTMTQEALRDCIADCLRARNGAHIDDEAELRSDEQVDEFSGAWNDQW